jgi:hypothetical protein
MHGRFLARRAECSGGGRARSAVTAKVSFATRGRRGARSEVSLVMTIAARKRRGDAAGTTPFWDEVAAIVVGRGGTVKAAH